VIVVIGAMRMALRSIRANRVRSVLTMLGIVVGVGSVILLVAAGHATQQAVEQKLEALGTNRLTLYPGVDYLWQLPPGVAGLLTEDDVAAVRAVGAAGGVAEVAPVLAPQVRLQTNSRSVTVGQFSGTSPSYLSMGNFRLAGGRAFTADEDRRRARVMVLGSVTASRLFGGGRAVGQPIVANGVRFRVVGVLASRGGDRNADNIAVAPYEATRDSLSGAAAPLSSIAVQATSRAATTTAQEPISTALRRSHRLTDDQSNDFYIEDQASLLDTTDSVTTVLRLVLGGVAGTSLFIGGMGVMNIMLVTVLERTREIGIRKAIGARRRHIIAQFLIEAAVLCLLGGLVGVAVGIGGAAVATAMTDYSAVVGPSAVALALGVAVAVGVFFGYYPASRAAGLRPIEALRRE